ncbi:MAG: trigger factor [Deltaproteobacteria bacterium RBG_13_47_9]|nr:MAG: trigger factor [Deltaproteobacteria bacterium RBG_13_47_9]
MKAIVEDISSIKKKVNVEIPEDQVIKEIDSFYGELKKKAKIKGFRPGKIPRDILERYFKDYVKAEVTQKLIQETCAEAFTQANLNPISPPLIDPQELEIGKPFQYTATVEVKPEFKVEEYLGLKIEGKKEGLKEEEVEERLKSLQDLHAHLKTIPNERPVQTGDHVILDYEAAMDDKPLEEGKAIDYTVEVGGGRFIPALEEKLLGMRSEEKKEVEVDFPNDYGYQKWAGKKITFSLKIKEIKEKVLPPLDDEFAKDLGDYSSLEELRDKLRGEIQREKDLMLERQLKDQLVDQLLQTNPFEVPESLVEEQSKSLVSGSKLRLASQGIDLKDINLSEERLKEDYREIARKQVQVFLILEKITSIEGITVEEEEVEDRLKDISERTHQKLEVVKRHYEKNGLIPDLKARIMSDKTLDYLFQKADIHYT